MSGYSQFSIIQELPVQQESIVMLVGAALDGPSNTPFEIHLNAEAHEVLGKSPLADAYHAARQAGANNIMAYRINGTHATAILKDKDGVELVELRSVSAASKYNDIQVVIYPTHIFVVGLNNTSRSYFFDKVRTTTELIYAINRDAHYGLIDFTAVGIKDYVPLTGIVDTPTTVFFNGGDDEAHLIPSRDPRSEAPTDISTSIPTLKERLVNALFGSNERDIQERTPGGELGALSYGVIAVCDMYHDDDPELTEMLGSFCMNKTKDSGSGCIGVIGVKPIFPEVVDEGDEVDFDDTIKTRVTELVNLSQSLPDTEAYKYVQVVVGHTGYVKSLENSVSTAYAFAATQSLFRYHTIMTNKQISGFGKLNYEIRKEDIALLASNGYTCIVPSIRRGFVPFYSTSYSKDKESVMARPHNLRISQYVSRMISEKLDGLIGNTYSVLSVKAAIEATKEELIELVKAKVIKDYELSYEFVSDTYSLNLEVALSTFSEIQAVSSSVTISFPKGVTFE